MRIVPLSLLLFFCVGCCCPRTRCPTPCCPPVSPAAPTPRLAAPVPPPPAQSDAGGQVVEIHAVADIVKAMPAVQVVTVNGTEDISGMDALLHVLEHDPALQGDAEPPTIAPQGEGTIVVRATRAQQEAVAQILDNQRGQLKKAVR